MELAAVAAEAAISSVVGNLSKWLIQKAVFLQGVEEQVQWLRDELLRMQCFLKDAAEKEANDESVRNWISEIRQVAHDAEDAIETYILKVKTARRSRWLLGSCASLPDLDRVGKTIESIQKRLQDIESSRRRYGIRDLREGVDSARRSEVERRRRLPHWQKDKDVVGLEKDVEQLLQESILEKTKQGLSIATIVGMGGIGKSALAREIYNRADIAAEFECHAWVVVSRQFTREDIFKQIMQQLHKSEKDKLNVVKTMKKLEESVKENLRREEILKEMLHTHLVGKRYFIVLDDVWEEADWKSLTSAFPDEQDKASRVLITSRRLDVLNSAGYVHEMKVLDPDKSLKLFLKKALNGKIDSKFPEDLQNIGREILKRCGGLPLAITDIGGLLVNQSKSKWQEVLKAMESHLGESEDDYVYGILELSYHNLPPEVKPCFLYLSFFKEDATIRTKKLVNIWIAEGLVPNGRGERTREETAMIYLDELIKRNLVQVKEMTIDDQVKSCYMHHLLRKLSITKAKEEIGFEILSAEGISDQSSHKTRHLAVHYSKERFISSKNQNRMFISSKNQNKHLYSVLFYGNGERLKFEDLGSTSYWRSFKFLRVLDFEGFRLMGNLPNKAIGALTGLKYLGLRNTGIKQLPSSLCRLKRLEVLDIAQNDIMELPKVIWELESLRHLYVNTIYFGPPLGIDTFKKIATLKYISETSPLLNRIAQLTSLRKLGLVVFTESNLSYLYNSLAMLEHFVSLSITDEVISPQKDGIPAFLRGFRVLDHLTKLKLKNFSTSGLPSAIHFPPNLSYLSSIDSYIYDDSIQVLKKLPKLSYLKLHGEYWGDKMWILNGEFPNLKVLFLRKMTGLREVQVEKGAMPELQRLEIYECEDLVVRISMSNPQELKILRDKGVDLCLHD